LLHILSVFDMHAAPSLVKSTITCKALWNTCILFPHTSNLKLTSSESISTSKLSHYFAGRVVIHLRACGGRACCIKWFHTSLFTNSFDWKSATVLLIKRKMSLVSVFPYNDLKPVFENFPFLLSRTKVKTVIFYHSDVWVKTKARITKEVEGGSKGENLKIKVPMRKK